MHQDPDSSCLQLLSWKGKCFWKQVQPRVDLLPHPQLVDHQMDRADAPAVDSPGFLRHLIMNIAGLDDWLGLIAPTAVGVQATSNSALAGYAGS